MSSDQGALLSAPKQSSWYRQAIKQLLGKFGLRLTSSRRRYQLGDAVMHLRDRGINPQTLVDVGVAWGTNELYNPFPDAALLLVEPNPQWKNYIERILQTRTGDAVFAAAGAEESEVTLYIWRGAEGSSSIFHSNIAENGVADPVNVSVKRLDDICHQMKCKPPYLVKIDVQGAEAEVIKGMGGIINETEAIIVETSLFADETAPDFGQILSMMDDYNWKLYDIVGTHYRPRDAALAQFDAIFVPSVGKIRNSNSWH